MTKNMDPAVFAETQARIDRQKRQAIADKVAAARAIPATLTPVASDFDLTPTKQGKGQGLLEAVIQREVLAILGRHPRVAWVRRINSGAYKDGERFIRYGFKGCSDILGQLVTGQFLACETKRRGAQPTPEQAAFLTEVSRHGGVAFIARSASDVFLALGPLCT